MFGDWPRRAGNFSASVGANVVEFGKLLGAGQRLFDSADLLDGSARIAVHRHCAADYSILVDGRASGSSLEG